MVDLERGGKLRLSIKALQPAPEGWVEPERKPRPERRDGDRGGRGGRRDDRGGRGGNRRDDRRGGR
ncbi:hypothetical protein FACS189456_7140 [Bacteroidia bacterium]|nr:hypothetical protein FACS189456_7140 [Bacteroidia bacterium]